MADDLQVFPLRLPFPTVDPFLFCMHHDDAYPAGNERLGPAASLEGREIGQDFAGKDGWRMYHGDVVPGFPQHPHRGFETVTIVRRGLIDHSDSLGAAARFGAGDVQWITAGRGIVHSEMFPLLKRDAPNPVELFQIWLNLPKAEKLAEPAFKMFWADQVPRIATEGVDVSVIAGSLGGARPPSPPPHSWAARADADVAIATIVLAPGARWTLPAPAGDRTVRALYFFRGTEPIRVAGERVAPWHGIAIAKGGDIAVENAGAAPAELLLLQGRPIEEPVAQYGPFVMTTRAEIEQAFADYRATQFGGWPWKNDGPVHDDKPRFARHPDGRVESAKTAA